MDRDAPGGRALSPAAADRPPAGGTTSALDELVAVMDRLRSPGGCPWDAEQTHASLAPYALEEAYELVEAIEHDDRAGLREELGDLLLQVVFHARVAQEDADDPFDVQDVAADLVAKLVRRHPHVFADEQSAPDDEGRHVAWDRIKRAEKDRASALDGVPLALGALARTQKLVARAERAGLAVDAPAGDDLGARLFALVREARAAGLDAEGELRRTTAGWEARVRAAESG
ncbi:MazG family protein [Cellulomonas sp. CW35]|uniref:MazG family protein n=1 Tax=Cellulomonas sp. CW35 TaxID=3458249 RepID=UPI004033F2E3